MRLYKNTTRWIAGLSAVCVLSLFLSSCLKSNDHYPAPPVAYLSFIQASPGQPPLDFYLNNNKVNYAPIAYGSGLDYIRAFTGTRIANFYNQSTTKILSDTIKLGQDTAYTLFLTNTAAHPQALLLTDSLTQPSTGNASIRFVNVSSDAGAVDLAVQGGAVLVSNKAFKGFSSFISEPGDKAYNLEVRQAGTNTVLATLANVNLKNNVVYTIWLYGLASAGNASTDKLTIGVVPNAYY